MLRVYKSSDKDGAYDVQLFSTNKLWQEFDFQQRRKRSKNYVDEVKSQISSLLQKDNVKLKSLKMITGRASMETGGGVDNDPEIDKLQQALGVKVALMDYSKDRYFIYPNSKINDRYYDNRAAQTISVLAKDGKYYLLTVGGYIRSVQPVAEMLGLEARRSGGIAGRYSIDVSLKKPKISISQLKKCIVLMQKGLKAESDAEAEFYKNWRNPD
jgi:hypothetical protein